MYKAPVKGEYATTIDWEDRPQAARPDPAADRIRDVDLCKLHGWTMDDLDVATNKFDYPRPIAGGWGRPRIFSRAADAAWWERTPADLKRLGFTVK